jgi:thymidylate synthase
MKRFSSYQEAENEMISRIISIPDFINKDTHEIICDGFILTNPMNNRNDRSNYEYADEFFKWMLSGETELSEKIRELNPWAERFVASTNLPENFSSSYGKKLLSQLDPIVTELKKDNGSRRGYINILVPEDNIILHTKTTHEYPCTIGLHFMIRDRKLILIVQMRSNNCLSVMPYDVYNFTMLQKYVADLVSIEQGDYYHQINSAHLYKGDVRRIIERRNETKA